MAEKLTENSGDPLGYIQHRRYVVALLHMSPTTPEEVMKLIDNSNATKAPGSDGIPCHLIKLTKMVIAPILANLFNACMCHSIFPDVFKIAEVIPLFKGGITYVLGNYRPISMLLLFEKVIARR